MDHEARVALVRSFANALVQRFGPAVAAVGIYGSVARGDEGPHSDVDVLVLSYSPLFPPPSSHLVGETVVYVNTYLLADAERELREPVPAFPERLGGWLDILSIYDPHQQIPRLQGLARSVPPDLFRKSAELALLGGRDMLGKLRNCRQRYDEEGLREAAVWLTLYAAWAVASLNRSPFRSDNEIFTAHRRFAAVPRGYEVIRDLRYGRTPREEIYQTAEAFWDNLERFAREQGVPLPRSPW